MGEEYLKVLQYLDCNVTIVGRNSEKASTLAKKYNFSGFGNGIEYLDSLSSIDAFDTVIIASAIESLKDIAIACLKKGFNKILIEKPGAINLKELREIEGYRTKEQKIWIAYNRRYYSSVLKLQEIISKEPVQACFFDFTDREKDILLSSKSDSVKSIWGFANSSHVIDTAFSLIGYPEEMTCDSSGYLKEHPTGSTFVGHGKTKEVLFSYFASWQGGGRWNVEISTSEGRYKLSPIEELQFCKKNQFNWVNIELSDQDDINFKPGLKKMMSSVLNEDSIHLPMLNEQIEFCKNINRIFNYED